MMRTLGLLSVLGTAGAVRYGDAEEVAGCAGWSIDDTVGTVERRLQTGETTAVGGSSGWVVKPGNAPYDDIMANVGDTLVFEYSSFYHDVMLVDNDQCDFSSGTMMDESGSLEWTATEPGTWIFACTRGDHCAVGNQQVRVVVEDSAGPADLGFTVAEPESCSSLLPADQIQQMNAAIESSPVVMLGISNRGCTNAASARFTADGTCVEFVEINSQQWSYLQCLHPQDRMCQGCGFSHSYVWIDGAYIGNGFAVRDMTPANMAERLDAAGADTTCDGCESHLAGAALTAAEVDALIADNPVMLFGWDGCPCTGIARQRLISAGICFNEFIWTSSQERLMDYLNCRNPWSGGCPNRGAAGPECSGGGEHHSFIFIDEQFIDNGFGFSSVRLPDARLDALTTAAGAETTCGIIPPSGDPVFTDFSYMLTFNPPKKNYGVSVTDMDGDGDFEMVIAGYGNPNLVYSWNADTDSFDSVAPEPLQDSSRSAIGVASCDIDGDGREEIYVLNTDSYSGSTTTSDRLFRRDASGNWEDLFEQPQNVDAASFIAGRSVACLDRKGDGTYGIFAANYGRFYEHMPMKLYEMGADRALVDVAPDLGMDRTTGGRALIAGAFVSPDGHSMDLFANNENGCNFLYRNEGGDGETFTEVAAQAGLADCTNTGRGTVPMDANGDGVLDIVWGNWMGNHRMMINDNDGTGHYTNAATPEMAASSRIRTVIAADWDNDGQEELFWNNIPGENRLFTRSNGEWTPINVGAALEPTGHGTGAAYGDFNGDGCLELLISHGESADEPLSYFRPDNCSPPSAGGNHFIRVMPLTQFGAPARGATVRLGVSGLVAADGVQTHIRNIDAGSGYLCQQEPVAHFGLGEATSVAEVTITWPSGDIVSISNPEVDTMHRIPHPQTGESTPFPDTPSVTVVGDLDGDLVVSVNDLLLLLGSYGSTSPSDARNDVNGDGSIDVNDLLLLLGNFGAHHDAIQGR